MECSQLTIVCLTPKGRHKINSAQVLFIYSSISITSRCQVEDYYLAIADYYPQSPMRIEDYYLATWVETWNVICSGAILRSTRYIPSSPSLHSVYAFLEQASRSIKEPIISQGHNHNYRHNVHPIETLDRLGSELLLNVPQRMLEQHLLQ